MSIPLTFGLSRSRLGYRMEQYMQESVGIRTPTGEVTSLRLAVKYTEDDIDIARRIGDRYDPGTILTVAGSKFKILRNEPLEFVEIRHNKAVDAERAEAISEVVAPAPEPVTQLAVEVGQTWVTKDSRRKGEPFQITAVEDDHVLTDKGLKIQRHRLNRYRRLS